MSEQTTEEWVTPSRLRKLVWGAAVLLIVTNLVAYSSGQSVGYDEGSAEGYSDGYSEGYSMGEAAGYADGYSAGGASGFSDGYEEGRVDGYREGLTDGCESVFESLGYYTYVTAYDPFSFSNRYPGRTYFSKFNC
jgi:flagellar biosynthesis/type III secretory pathway protein FliH